jgi:hypothetical protein
MVTDTRKIAILMLTLCLCASIFTPIATAKDAFAPSWLKEGAYVKYEPSISGASSLGVVGFFDLSNPKFAGTNYTLPGLQVDAVLETISSSLIWRCLSVNDTMAKLQVTLDFVGKLNFHKENLEWINNSSKEMPVQRTAEVYVDLYNRGVYNADGVFLGTTHLWLPANPNNGQEITLWEENSETTTAPVAIPNNVATTVQGKQDIFQTGSQFTIKNNPLGFRLSYDLDTGLGVSGMFCWDPIFAAVGISYGTVGVVFETNIDLGPEHSEIYWNQILPYTIIPIAIILLVAALMIKRGKKKN